MEFHACRSSWESPRSSSRKSRAKNCWRSVRGGSGGASPFGSGSGAEGTPLASALSGSPTGGASISPTKPGSCPSMDSLPSGMRSGSSTDGSASGPLSNGGPDTSTSTTSGVPPPFSPGRVGSSPGMGGISPCSPISMGRPLSGAPMSWGGPSSVAGASIPGCSASMAAVGSSILAVAF